MADFLSELLHDKHQVARELLAVLRPEDFERLREAAGERGNPNRVRAIDLLVAAGDAQIETLLLRVFKEDGDAGFRGLAAGQLGRLGAGQEVERVLRDTLLTERDHAVQIQIAGALARIGTADAITPLSRFVEIATEGPRHEQAVFARAVVAYRSGVSGYELPAPESRDMLPLNPDAAKRIVVEPAPVREALLARGGVRRDVWGLDLDIEHSYLIDCGATRLVLFIDIKAVSRHPGVVGLVIERSQEDGSYYLRWLVLSWSAGKDSRRVVAVHRPSGQRVLGGTLTGDANGGSFELHAVKAAGNVPVLLRGRVAEKGIQMLEALSEDRATPRRVPTPTQPPGR